jgi:hypothetical protein
MCVMNGAEEQMYSPCIIKGEYESLKLLRIQLKKK